VRGRLRRWRTGGDDEMRGEDELLFFKGDLRAVLEHQTTLLVSEVESAPEDHLLHVDEDAWARSLAERYRVDAPVLHAEKWWMDPPEEVQVDVSWDYQRRAILDPSRPAYIAGYRVVVHIPFTGDKGVFELTPSTRTYNPPRARVDAGELVQVIEYPHDTPANVKEEAQDLVSRVQQYLTWAASDIETFNRTLDGHARGAIQRRRERVRKNYEHLAETGIPLARAEESAKTYIADAIVRRPAPAAASAPTSQPMPLEPLLGDEVFEHILEVIRASAEAMERSPKTYAGMGEEDRRQVLLTALNTHYRGQTTAEAFNVNGKTDILIRHPEGRNLFIGECKLWSGAKGFSETIDQLFSYAAWRDTKLAIVMFVREKDLTGVVEKARTALKQHPQFVEWGEAGGETELRATVSWPGDERRHADLNVFFVHTPH
jgi:hypothetical protein